MLWVTIDRRGEVPLTQTTSTSLLEIGHGIRGVVFDGGVFADGRAIVVTDGIVVSAKRVRVVGVLGSDGVHGQKISSSCAGNGTKSTNSVVVAR